MTRDLYISTTISRADTDGDPEEFDVLVYFKVDSYSPGCPADLWGPAPHPEDPEEWEFSFLRAEFDTHPNIEPLTEAEIVGLKTWFADMPAAHDAARLVATEQADQGPDPDDARDRDYDDARFFGDLA